MGIEASSLALTSDRRRLADVLSEKPAADHGLLFDLLLFLLKQEQGPVGTLTSF